MSFFEEFKAFAIKGNVVDLAVAVVIGGAFGKIVSSMVSGIIMPLLGLLLGGINIAGKSITLGEAVVKWGEFLQSIIDFTIISFSIFVAIKILSFLKKEDKKVPELTKQEQLLSEIRDLLKDKIATDKFK